MGSYTTRTSTRLRQGPPEQLGKVSFPTSCDPKVQAQFERGVALLHSFWFGEGLKAFAAVAEHDPGCAMAHWGIAINRLLNPFGGEPAATFLKQGQAEIEKAKAIGAKTQRERDYIDAAAVLYTDVGSKRWAERALAYEEAMLGWSRAIRRTSKQKCFMRAQGRAAPRAAAAEVSGPSCLRASSWPTCCSRSASLGPR